MEIREKIPFHSYGVKPNSLIIKDLNKIRFSVEKEFKTSVRTKGHSRKEVDTKKVFISLVLNVYNKIQKKLGLRKVTLVSLARYMRYSSHSSISLHYINSVKGHMAVEEYIMENKDLKERYLVLKEEVEKGKFITFKSFLIAKRNELLSEIEAINDYLKKEHHDEEVKEGSE